MEIRELYRDEIGKLAHAAKDTLGARFPSCLELRVLRDNPRAFLPVAVAGTEIVGIALAELRDEHGKRVGSVRLLASFIGEAAVDRAVKLALLARLEAKFKDLQVDAVEVPADHDPDVLMTLERWGYHPAAGDEQSRGGDGRTDQRLVKPLRSAFPPWAQQRGPSSTGSGVVE